MTSPYLIPDLERDEGKRLKAYKDSRGIWTIGCGHNLQVDPRLFPQLQHLIDAGITQAQCDQLLAADVGAVEAKLNICIPWWTQLDPIRADVMVNLAFNLGVHGLMEWPHTLALIRGKSYDQAGDAIQHCEPWCDEVGNRAVRLGRQMATGTHQVAPV